MGRLILILGGARSGKSTHGQRLAKAHGGKVVFIATAEAQDDEMRDRIAAHKSERPLDWLTLEIPFTDATAPTVIDAVAVPVLPLALVAVTT